MANAENIYVSEATPTETWEKLQSDPNAVLVDVRTAAELSFVGLPDLSSIGKRVVPVEWVKFPEMARNESFVEQLFDNFGDEIPSTIFFLCRSGFRSMAAAELVLGSGYDIACVNVLEGFEGDKDALHHRGSVNGWKKHGLPWHQS